MLWWSIAPQQITLKCSGLKITVIIIIMILWVRNLGRAQLACFCSMMSGTSAGNTWMAGEVKQQKAEKALSLSLSLSHTHTHTHTNTHVLQIASLGFPTIWQLRASRPRAPRDRKWELPVSQGLHSEAGHLLYFYHILPYFVGQSSHRAHPDSKGGNSEPTSWWKGYQRIWGHF